MFKTPLSPYIFAATFLTGSFGGGWVVHKVWYGKTQAAKLKQMRAAVTATEAALSSSKVLADEAAITAQTEAKARIDAENRLSQAYKDNALLAKSRASTQTKIIEKGEHLGQKLKTDYPCIYEPWPNELREFAFDNQAPKYLSDFAGRVDSAGE